MVRNITRILICILIVLLGELRVLLTFIELPTKCIHNGKDVFLSLPTGFGKSVCYETLPFVRNYKHSDGRTGGGCSVIFVVSPLVSLIMEAIAA